MPLPRSTSFIPAGPPQVGKRTARADEHRLDRQGAARIVRGLARRAGTTNPVGPHTLRYAFITAALDAGCRSGCPGCQRAGFPSAAALMTA